ncbi:Heterokaryon incompatibility protein (HET) domain containing protein [Hyaloscypha variabilis]
MDLERYPSAPLTGPQDIRLLKLLPGSVDEPVKCTLLPYTIESPDQQLNYEAISYEWGSPGQYATIELNGQKYQIQANLFAFLKILRSGIVGEGRVLWADAVCINQKDIQERGRQVRIMRKIFKQADRVLSWLGPAANGSDMVFDFCLKLQEACVAISESLDTSAKDMALSHSVTSRIMITHAEEIFDVMHYWGSDRSVNMEEYVALNTREKEWRFIKEELYDMLFTLQSRSYWKRVWIVPEVTLGKEVIVHCGEMRMDFDVICQAAKLIPKLRKGRGTTRYKMTVTPPSFSALSSYRSSHRGNEWSLHQLLEAFGHSQCTLLHDRIYAFLDANTDFRKGQPSVINYSCTPEELNHSPINFCRKLLIILRLQEEQCISWILSHRKTYEKLFERLCTFNYKVGVSSYNTVARPANVEFYDEGVYQFVVTEDKDDDSCSTEDGDVHGSLIRTKSLAQPEDVFYETNYGAIGAIYRHKRQHGHAQIQSQPTLNPDAHGEQSFVGIGIGIKAPHDYNKAMRMLFNLLEDAEMAFILRGLKNQNQWEWGDGWKVPLSCFDLVLLSSFSGTHYLFDWVSVYDNT